MGALVFSTFVKTIDSHHHFWKYDAEEYAWISADMEALRRDFLPPDLEREIAAADVDAVVSVQARQTIAETEWLLELAAKNDFISGVVGWVPLVDPGLREILDVTLAGKEKLKAVRHVLQGEKDDFYILRDDFNRGISLLHDFGLVYDILIYQRHLPQTIEFVDKHPDQVFVLDHIAKPVIESSMPPESWSKPIADLAKRENVFCKLSGIVTEVRLDAWDEALLAPYYEHVLEAFGPSRLLFGTDWPVCLLRAAYREWTRAVRKFIASLSGDEQARILGGTAARAYRLSN